MSRLERVLAEHEVQGKLGGESFDREYLREALSAAGKQTTVAFWAAVGAQVVMFLLACWLAISNSRDPEVVGYILAGGGGGVAAGAFAVVRLWKEKVTTDLTLALVGSLNEAAARSVLTVVLETLRKPRGKPRRTADNSNE
jgi:hypothetical protein